MNILVVAGCSLYENTSANLCHRSYISAMVNLGHSVDLVCFSEKDISVDDSIELPKINNIYKYDGLSLYEKLALRNSSGNAQNDIASPSTAAKNENSSSVGFKTKVVDGIKKLVRSSYGIYNPSIAWYRRAKNFKSDKKYDLVISLSYPQVSHLLAARLIEKKQVKTDRWIQLWEDPWTTDLGNCDGYKKAFKAESKLLKSCKEIVYTTPLTLKRQQELFKDSAENMHWLPLPAYYKMDKTNYSKPVNHYGYFGDYGPSIRNLEPFYEAALKENIYVNICGSPSTLFESKKNVHIYPRQPLDKLKTFEDDTNVIICLFNLGGGQIPGKICQYASSDKIILAILDGSPEEQKIIKEYYEKFNRFIFCHNTVDSISTAIETIESGKVDEKYKKPIDVFLPETIVERLLNGDYE